MFTIKIMIKDQLNKLLTVEEVVLIVNRTARNVRHWIKDGAKVNGKIIKLEIIEPKSKILIDPKVLKSFMKKTGKGDITDIPSYLR